jgi:hypothetical protein
MTAKKSKKAKTGGSTHRQGLAHTKDGNLKVAATKALPRKEPG